MCLLWILRLSWTSADGLDVREVAISRILGDVSIVYGGMTMPFTSTWRQPSSGANNMNRLAVPLRSYS